MAVWSFFTLAKLLSRKGKCIGKLSAEKATYEKSSTKLAPITLLDSKIYN